MNSACQIGCVQHCRGIFFLHNHVAASYGFTFHMNRFNTKPGAREHKPNLHTITVPGWKVETRLRVKRYSRHTVGVTPRGQRRAGSILAIERLYAYQSAG